MPNHRVTTRAALLERIRKTGGLLNALETELGRLEDQPSAEHPIVFWRVRRRMTQAKLAQAVGITAPALCKIEHKAGFAARAETRAKIATALSVPEDWLYFQRTRDG